MTVQSYLKRYPHARPSTVAHLLKRDAVLQQLRKEIAKPKRPWWMFWRAK